MWFILILLAVHVNGDEICERNPVELCNRDNLPYLMMPVNVDDFDNTCNEYSQYVDCLETYEATCPDEYIITFFSEGDAKYMYSIIREICDKNSSLNIEYRKNFECIKSATDYHFDNCSLESELKSDEYFTFLREQLKEGVLDAATAWEKYFVLPQCLSHSFTISCILHEIADSCGIPAENVAIELKQRTNTLLIYCDIEDIPRLRTGYIEFLQGSTEAHILKRILHTDESFDETA